MFSTLSDKQREIVFNKSGHLAVRACPGSGKTYSVAARLAHRIQNWKHHRKGIAALSFTNVAWQKIGQQLKHSFEVSESISYPHFLGTLDSFINQHIFLPFGHLVMGCEKRPVLVGEPHGSWHYYIHEKCYEQYFDIVSYNVDGSLIYPEIQGMFFFGYSKFFKKNGTESQHAVNMRDVKECFWREGYATQADANYFAVKILDSYPAIAKAMVIRFPEFVIDEAQDTTEAQMTLIDILIENGLQEVILIGDPDQAIFEWNNARPELFNQKYDAWKENSVEFNENRRSSQRICDFTVKLTSLPQATRAVDDEVKNCSLSPEIIAYDYNDVDSIHGLIKAFLRKCKANGIEASPREVAVLVRSGSFVATILGDTVPGKPVRPWVPYDPITRDVVKAKFLIDNRRHKDGYKLLEAVFTKARLHKVQCLREDIQARIDEIGFTQHRKEVYKIANLLPTTHDMNVDTWINDATGALRGTGLRVNIDTSKETVPIKDLFQKERGASVSDEYRLGTVHSVKGETFEAVLLLLKQKGAKGSHYKTLLQKDVKTKDDEELRIVYVAMTRPRRLLMLGVPEKCYEGWNNNFNLAGAGAGD